MRYQGNGSERHDIALSRRALELLVEIGSERDPRSFRRYGEAVNFSKRAERDITGDEEVAEKPWIRSCGWRHVDKKAVERLRLLRRRQEIDVISLADWIGFHWAENLFLPHNERRPCPGRQETAFEIRAVGGDRIADDLLSQLSRQIELDPARKGIMARQRHVQPPCGPGDGPALHQKRGEHGDEGDIEIEVGL